MPMIALPGTLCAPSIFDPLADRLRDTIALEAWSWLTQPGPWDIPAVADRLAGHLADRYEGPVLVCGHSTGGAIALQLAITRPELVAGLVLVDTGAHMHGHGDVDAIVRRVRDEWGEPLRRAVIERSFHVLPDPGVMADLLGWAAELEAQAVHDVLASQRDLDLTDGLDDIAVPTVVIHGLHDRARPAEQGRELAAAIPGAALRLLGTGHTPVFEAPDEVAAIINDVHAPMPST